MYVKMSELMRKHDVCVFYFFSDDRKLNKMTEVSK